MLDNRLNKEITSLLMIMERLRGPDGCPWDQKQNYSSLQPYIIEEAYELVEAIQKEDIDLQKEELGDLLLQVVFQAQIAKEEGDFDLCDVIEILSEKLLRRHPHVFAEKKVETVEEVRDIWYEVKKDEKDSGKEVQSILDDFSRSQTALNQAYEIQEKAAKVGFDWSEIKSVLDKVKEEVKEIEDAIDSADEKQAGLELGDLLFASVNLSRFLKVNPEIALLNTILKFKERFSYIEKSVKEQGKKFEEMTLQELDIFWEEAKKIESIRGGVS